MVTIAVTVLVIVVVVVNVTYASESYIVISLQEKLQIKTQKYRKNINLYIPSLDG